MRYRTTRQAERDLIDLDVDGDLQFATDRAERYQRGLIRTFKRLPDNPRMAREPTEFVPPVRIYPYELTKADQSARLMRLHIGA
jgi:toxin ParE1/3/4